MDSDLSMRVNKGANITSLHGTDLGHLGVKGVLIKIGFAETLEGKVTAIGDIAA